MSLSKYNDKDSLTYEEVLQKYVNEKMELVRLELLLDSLYMEKNKEEEWSARTETAKNLYNETKELLEYLETLFVKMRVKKASKSMIS